jgi:outer membrane protein
MADAASRLRALALGLLLGGCASRAVELAPPRPDQPWAPTTNPAGEILSRPAGPAGSGGFVLPANPALAQAGAGVAEVTVPDRPLDLPGLIDLAQRSNPRTRIAWGEARKAALATGIAESTLLPRLILGIIGGWANPGQQQQSVAQYNLGSVSASGTGGIGALSLSWLVYDGGERQAIIDAARQGSIIGNIAFTGVHQQLIHAVSLAYHAHLAAQARVAAARQALGNAETVQAAAEERQKRGVGTVVEVAQARQAAAQAKLALVQAEGGERDTRLSLLAAIGISPLSRLRVAEAPGQRLPDGLGQAAATAIEQALQRRPDMLSAFAAEKAAAAQEDAARASFQPKLFVAATGSYNRGQLGVSAIPSIGQQLPTLNLSSSGLGGSVLAGVTLPLYDGGTRSAILAQARAGVENAGAQRAQTRTEATRQIAQADNTLRTGLAAHAAAEAARGAAETTYEAALAAYRNGVGSVTEVTAAQTQLLAARVAVADARAAALSAGVTLSLATGTLGEAPR